MLLVYNAVFFLAFVIYSPILLFKLTRRGGLTAEYWQRFGLFSRATRDRLSRLEAPVWIHAVSVGETVAALSFIRRWRERDPAVEIVLSSTTTTGHALAARKLPPEVPLIYCPLDFPWAVRAALKAVRPRLLLIFEVEIWPNLITLATRAGVRIALANGRMSDRSSRGYARHRWFFGPLFARFSVLCVQTPEDAERTRAVVGDRVPVMVCNTMKFDQIPDSDGSDNTALLQEVFGPGERIVWTVGSTHAGEEELVLDVLGELQPEFPALRMVLVPRHHERTAEVVATCRERGVRFRLLRPRDDLPGCSGPADVLIVNTTGELMNFYAAGDLAYVGKSLAGNEGGHNIIEPAIFGKPIIHGSNMQNFRAVAAAFRRADAVIEVTADAGLTEAVRNLLANPAEREALGKRAREVVETGRGAIEKTLAQLERVLTVEEEDA